MTATVLTAEEAVRRMTPEELIAFRNWFHEFDAAAWDRKIESDVASGRLDWLIDEAKADVREGRTTTR